MWPWKLCGMSVYVHAHVWTSTNPLENCGRHLCTWHCLRERQREPDMECQNPPLTALPDGIQHQQAQTLWNKLLTHCVLALPWRDREMDPKEHTRPVSQGPKNGPLWERETEEEEGRNNLLFLPLDYNIGLARLNIHWNFLLPAETSPLITTKCPSNLLHIQDLGWGGQRDEPGMVRVHLFSPCTAARRLM